MTSQPASVRVTVRVNTVPETAFAVFTEEIDSWYVRDRHTFADPDRAVGIRFEPGVGGRLIEVYDRGTGEGREMGRITAWDPGRRLAFVDGLGTEVEVSFEDAGGQTRVTLEHRGLERLRPDLAERHARHGWRLLLPWYQRHLEHNEERSSR
jgi:Activator of Hsp90 ATPase homolog 1-like protein